MTGQLVPLRTAFRPYAAALRPFLGPFGGTDVDACCARRACRCECGCRAHSHYRRCRPCGFGQHAGPPVAWPLLLATRAGLAFGDWPPVPRRLRHVLAGAA